MLKMRDCSKPDSVSLTLLGSFSTNHVEIPFWVAISVSHITALVGVRGRKVNLVFLRLSGAPDLTHMTCLVVRAG